MRLRYLVAPLVVLIALAALACSGNDSGSTATPTAVQEASAVPSPAAFPVTVTDSNDKQLVFESAPERIVALAPSFVEILFAVGAGDAVVAVDENTDFPPEASAKTKLSGFEPSTEAIAALEPDLVIILFDPGGLEEALEGLGIPVLFLASPQSVEGVFDQIDLLGQVTGRLEEAEALIADMQDGIDAITSKLADVQEGPRVFHEVDSTYFSAGTGSFVGDLYSILRAENIAEAAGEAYPQMSAEAIIKADPEVIILADVDAGESPDTVKARPGWKSISAVRNDRIYTVDPSLISQPGPRLVEALRTLAAYLYPERFP
jgi:iron complex transport system substrate-binding protein